MAGNLDLNTDEKKFSRLFGWLIGLTAIVFFFRIGATPVYILDEAKNAQCAREMWYHGNWIVPTFNGELRTDKPPLHYWFMALSYTLFGVGEWQARLFSAFMGIGTIAISFYFVKRFLGVATAFFTALVLAISTHFIFEFRLAVPDPFLIFFTTLGLFSGFAYLEERKWIWLLLTAVSLGIATLAKGPVALGLPGMAMVLLIIFQKKWWVFGDWRVLIAACVYVAVAVPWYVWVHKATDGAFTQGFFLEHNLQRFSGKMEGHGGPFIITPIIVMIGMLPFSVAIVPVIKSLRTGWKNNLVLFASIVAAVYIVFFSLSKTKLPNYPMPCYPFAALVVAVFLNDCYERKTRIPKYSWWILLSIGVALPVAGFIALQMEPELAPLRWWAIGLAILPCAVLAAFRSVASSYSKAILLLVAGYFIFNLYFTGVAYPVVYRKNPVTHFQPLLSKGKNMVVAYKDYNPAFNFNASSDSFTVKIFKSAADIENYCRNLPADSIDKVYVITRTEFAADLNDSSFLQIGTYRDIFELPTTAILEWRERN